MMIRLGSQPLRKTFSTLTRGTTAISSPSRPPLSLPTSSSSSTLHNSFVSPTQAQARFYSRSELSCAEDTRTSPFPSSSLFGPLHQRCLPSSVGGPLIPAHRNRPLSTTSNFPSAASEEDSLEDDGSLIDPFPPTAIPRGKYKANYFFSASSQSNRPTRPDKFKIPRKRCNILMSLATAHAEEKSREAKPKVFNTEFERGDAVEVEYASSLDTRTRTISKFRGVVLGRTNRGLASSFTVRDVVQEEVIERRIPLHSPLLMGIRVLKKNWIGKKKIRRAQLTYLRKRPDVEVNVSGDKSL